MVFRCEKELEEAAVAFFKEMGFLYSWRVPLHNRVIDFAAIDCEGQLIGIEFKLKNWRRALEQAVRHSNSLDYIYVCLPGGNYLEKLKGKAEELGVGVMIYSAKAETITIELPAKRMTRQWKPNLEYLRDYLTARGTIRR